MADLESRPLVVTETVGVWDVVCSGSCAMQGDDETVENTHLLFPYRGMYVHHLGRAESVVDANHVIFLNADEPYRVSHPVAGGDATVSMRIDTTTLLELTPRELMRSRERSAFNRTQLPLHTSTQAVAATLRHRTRAGVIDALEAETLALTLVRSAFRHLGAHVAGSSARGRRLVDDTKQVIASDPGRRWSLSELGALAGVSPVYLTQVFQQTEGVPLYRYQLQLRLVRALDLLRDCHSVTDLAFDLGFSSHSHFTAAFRRAYGQTPSAFRRSAGV